MRAVRHENLVPFIGVSFDMDLLLIVTAYCTRGSLADILRDSELQLDNMFTSSLIVDLMKVRIQFSYFVLLNLDNLFTLFK